MTVVVCDDEPAVRFAVGEVLRSAGHEVVEVASAEAALARLDEADVVVTDLSMPGVDGMELLRRARAYDPGLPVVMLTARGSERIAVLAMKAGAHDYLPKPFDADELTLTVGRALERRQLARDSAVAAAERASGRMLIGASPAMRRLQTAIARFGPRDVTVLVTGPTGTGKELVARLLHAASRRADHPLVMVNCAALPPDLADAELFGHARGAFTGAREARPGFFARAHHGTLVLDEVGDLPLALQPKLLRALQEGEIQTVGGGIERVDVRVVASTHRDLAAEVRAGRFREDLYYRLAVIEIAVPPLADRRADVPALARALARRWAERFGLDDVSLSDRACEALAARSWPGNVRELDNAVGRAVAASDGGVIDALDPEAPAVPVVSDEPALSPPEVVPLRAALEALERQLIGDALAAAGNNKAEAARRLGLSRVTLLDRMKRLGG